MRVGKKTFKKRHASFDHRKRSKKKKTDVKIVKGRLMRSEPPNDPSAISDPKSRSVSWSKSQGRRVSKLPYSRSNPHGIAIGQQTLKSLGRAKNTVSTIAKTRTTRATHPTVSSFAAKRASLTRKGAMQRPTRGPTGNGSYVQPTLSSRTKQRGSPIKQTRVMSLSSGKTAGSVEGYRPLRARDSNSPRYPRGNSGTFYTDDKDNSQA